MALSFKWCDASIALEPVYEACIASNIQMDSKGATLEKMRHTDILGVFDDNKCVGAVMFVNDEFHGAIIPEYRGKWINKQFIKIVLDEKKKRGGLKTTINGATNLIEKAVRKFCAKYEIEVT